MKTLNPSERVAILGVIGPDSYDGVTAETGWIALTKFQAIMAVISVGELAAGATVDVKLEQASDDVGTGAKDITDKVLTQLTQVGGDADKQAILECWVDDLDLPNEFSHVRVSMTVVNAVDASVVVLGFDARYQPASDYDIASVAEIV